MAPLPSQARGQGRVEQREQNRNGNPLTFILSPFRRGGRINRANLQNSKLFLNSAGMAIGA